MLAESATVPGGNISQTKAQRRRGGKEKGGKEKGGKGQRKKEPGVFVCVWNPVSIDLRF